MESRRDFLKKASVFAGLSTVAHVIPASLLKAMSIEPAAGSTYKDAAHVVFLMQENRSFDHAFGTLKGVRGFNDPRAMPQRNGNPIWFQSNKDGQTFTPFRLDIKNSRSTWIGSLPHSWGDMVGARNEGKMDNWLEAKKAESEYAHIPLTMGYYDRKDIPFYYAMADAFTVCDQHFCSALTGTSSNRTFFFSGSIKEDPHDAKSLPHVYNSQIDYKNVGWKTFPERLEEAQIPWKVYQNELSLPVGFNDDQTDWLANFTDNSLEFFKQYQVRFHPAHTAYLQREVEALPSEIKRVEAIPQKSDEDIKLLESMKEKLVLAKEGLETWSKKGFNALSDFQKRIHERAFVTNEADPAYHKVENITYQDNGILREMVVPKGDVLHQFREDVNTGKLPMVSWLVAPSRFSDHPGSPWHGAWYIAEALDILTKNEEVWKKTIFILTYDENDGYFDHQSPFVPPHPKRPYSGKTSSGIDTETEFSVLDPEKPQNVQADSPIGLGFRVPMVVASPWTRGGYVNSQIFDHTSCLQFLEHFIEAKTGKEVKETNISSWRRSVCGDLSSVFRPTDDTPIPNLHFDRNQFIESIYHAKFKPLPGNFTAISAEELEQVKKTGDSSPFIPAQEPGVKFANALPYQHEVNLVPSKDGRLEIQFSAGKSLFGSKSAAGTFQVYVIGKFNLQKAGEKEEVEMNQWNFCVLPGDQIEYHWALEDFMTDTYELQCYGANGFFRSFKGTKSTLPLTVKVTAEMLSRKKASGSIEIIILSPQDQIITLTDNSYGLALETLTIHGGNTFRYLLDPVKSHGWYDFTVAIKGNTSFSQQYAGRIETGKDSISDPVMGRYRMKGRTESSS
ncbi:phospholipase C [Pedobacter sp. CAN_A7]|uniref:phosphocholine-specific phospholipase C n=1 Tax=Pedobacter sp. CAN_A7 TaxID=2787722 RepID=UPI0018C92EE0